jgi:hypothetical protein
LDDSTRETLLHRQTQFFGVYEQPEGFYYHYSTMTKQTEHSTVQGVRIQASKVSKETWHVFIQPSAAAFAALMAQVTGEGTLRSSCQLLPDKQPWLWTGA